MRGPPTHLADESRLIFSPYCDRYRFQPGAPAYKCLTPCGRGGCPFTAAAVAPVLLPAELALGLGLVETAAALIAATLQLTEPVGTAADFDGPMSWGGARFYRN